MYSEILNLEKSITSLENAIDKVESIIKLNISFKDNYHNYSQFKQENIKLKLKYWETKDETLLKLIKNNNNYMKLIELRVSDRIYILQNIFNLIGRFKNREYILHNPLNHNGFAYKNYENINDKLKNKIDDLKAFKDYYTKKLNNYKISHIDEILSIYNEHSEL